MPVQEIKTKMKRASPAELNAERNPEREREKSCQGGRLERVYQIEY